MSIAITDVTPDKVSSIVSNTRCCEYASGVDAYYTPVTQKWGFKMYSVMLKAYFTYFRQRILAADGLAPAVGDQMPTINAPADKWYGECKLFGYIVQTVKVAIDYKPEKFQAEPWSAHKPFDDAVLKLREQCAASLHAEVWDFSLRNMGFDDNDNLMLIDVGNGNDDAELHEIEELRRILIGKGLWRGDDVEYAAWGAPHIPQYGLDPSDAALLAELMDDDSGF